MFDTSTRRLFILVVTLIVCPLVRGHQQSATSKEANHKQSARNHLIVISTTTSNSQRDSFVRFNRSIKFNNLTLESLKDNTNEISSYQNGLSETDPNGEMRRQFESMREELARFKDDQDLILMLVEGANTIVNGNENELLSRFNEFHQANGTRLLFSADVTCWPESNLSARYPLHQPSSATNQSGGDSVRRFLDSRSLIGFASTLWDFMELSRSLREKDQSLLIEKISHDFQLYSTHVYLSEEHRQRLKIELDHRSSLFENLDAYYAPSGDPSRTNNQISNVELDFVNVNDTKMVAGSSVSLRNLMYDTKPLVIHGSGSNAKIELNSLGNYLGGAWTLASGCRLCNETMISLASIKDADMPIVLVAVFIEEPTPFLGGFFETLRELSYPKARMHVLIHNSIEYHANHTNDFIAAHGSKYASLELIDFKQSNGGNTTPVAADEARASRAGPAPIGGEWQAREYSLLKCKQLGCDYLLSLDSTARLELPESLRHLIETNRTIVAPLLSRPGKLWSNFWGAITRDGYYARSNDYVELVARDRVGLWNVPLLMNAYLIEGKFLRRQLELAAAQQAERRRKLSAAEVERNGQLKQGNKSDHHHHHHHHQADDDYGSATKPLAYYDSRYPTIRPALIFARNLRQMNQFQFVTNQHEFGHLVDPSDYNTTLKYPDFYQLTLNKPDWEREYLHENYTDLFDERDEDESNYPDRIRLEQPCQDVYWFPLVSDKFANQLIGLMEEFGQWSAGRNHDPRIEGGYESVPTRDIHFRQVGLHEMWLDFLREYVMPIQLKEYIGYEHDPPRTDLAFVVRYHPEEQPSLRPHHDSSTYTLNIALNTPGLDYEGGGCRFVRYNCSVTQSRKGWALIHPGRLTHYHEGLPVTRGTRYILVTFIDP